MRESLEEMSDDSATADRVEKKSIDEAIASFAMLVRIEYLFIYVLCSYEWEERRIRQPFFFFFVYFFFFGVMMMMMMMMMMFCV